MGGRDDPFFGEDGAAAKREIEIDFYFRLIRQVACIYFRFIMKLSAF